MKTITYENPIIYGKYRIYHYDGFMRHEWPFGFVHDDYDGAPDAKDNRFGLGKTIEDCIEQINEIES